MGSIAPPFSVKVSLASRSGLKSKWPMTVDLSGSSAPGRFEGEIGDLVVYGDIPPEIDGTFYRISLDRYLPKENPIPIDGDGTVSAFRIQDGHVDFKIKYVETERYKLERRARTSLFGLYKNPWSHHPCVRAAVDSTASTNVIHWANRLLVLEEAANPYEIDPDTLQTLRYDPFYDQIRAKSFTAHPKVDPFTEELVTFGYEAKGPATEDVVDLVNRQGWQEDRGIMDQAAVCNHDSRLRNHGALSDPHGMALRVPRRKESPPPGWQAGEHRVYKWKNCMNIHTAGAWEENGKLYIEASRVHDNVFPFFASAEGQNPAPDTKADFVRWEIDPSQPSESSLPDPHVILDLPAEFPRIDERFNTKKYKIIFLDVFLPQSEDGTENVFHGLNSLAMINTKTGDKQFFQPGNGATVQEPVFIPRSDNAPEGDGWVMAMIEQHATSHCELIILDTKDFSKPIAIAQLPFMVKSQVHGNWVDFKPLGSDRKSLVAVPGRVKISGKGALALL